MGTCWKHGNSVPKLRATHPHLLPFATLRELPELGTLATAMMAPEMPPDRVPWAKVQLLLEGGGTGQGYLEVGPLPNGRTSWLIKGFF